MPIQILSTFTRTGVGNYPLLLNTDVKGGWMIAPDAATRNAIPSALRQQGMVCWVIDVAKLYQLGADLVTWTEVTLGGGASSGTFTCPVGVNVRDAVYLSGADTVSQANATSSATIPCVGVVSSKPTGTSAVVQFGGELSGFVGLVAGNTYYVGLVAGTITNNVNAYVPGNVVHEVGWARNTTTLVVVIDRDWTQL